jgi:hypothetical protein
VFAVATVPCGEDLAQRGGATQAVNDRKQELSGAGPPHAGLLRS